MCVVLVKTLILLQMLPFFCVFPIDSREIYLKPRLFVKMFIYFASFSAFSFILHYDIMHLKRHTVPEKERRAPWGQQNRNEL